MITEKISALKMHKLTQEQYDRELSNGNIDETALYLIDDVDYIVEQGTNGVWTYRKWVSGIAELWALTTPSYSNVNVLQQELFFPISLTKVLSVNGTLNSTDNTSKQLYENVKVIKTIGSITILLHSPADIYTSSTVREVSVSVVGRWK